MISTLPLKHISTWGRNGRGGERAGSRHGLRGVALLLVLSFLFTGCGGKKGPDASQGPARVAIQSISPQETDTRTEIVIEGSDQIQQYTSFQLTEPLRLIVDITDADLSKFKDKIAVNKGSIIDITPSQVDNIARLEIALSQSVDTKVYAQGGKLMVELAKPVEAAKATPEAVTPAPTPAAAPEPAAPKEAAAAAAPAAVVETAAGEAGSAKVVRSVKATGSKQGAKVVIAADGTMKPNAFMIEGKRLVIDIEGTKSRVRPTTIPVRKGGLDKVRVGQFKPQTVRVVLDLTKTMEYTVTPEGNTLVVAMNIATAPKSEERPQERSAAQPEAAAAAATEKAVQDAPAPQEGAAPAPQETAAAAPKAQPASSGIEMVMGGKKYTGRRISLDLQDADLVNVLRMFGDLANLNMILSPDVKGKVTVRMVNIPWDQAMEIILKMNGLGYAIDDNILRIASMSALTKEANDEIQTKEAKKKAEDLVTRIIPINYSEASKIEGTIKKSLSSRGETVVDGRTNTLIVKDIARNVDEVLALVRQLDKPTPQIMIEARIVEASLNFNRTLGIQWGVNAQASPQYGNATGLKFPNTVGITGGPSMGGMQSGGNYLVNMPAPAGAGTGGGAIGFQFGSLSKALSLDLILSALESTGEGKVISTPRVSALDNREAKIEQGISIPFATSQAGGATNVQFVDAKLSLTVTPHATPDNRIFMKIAATKNAPDTSLLGAGGQPSIRKNEATTEILLVDGETAVIGGILVLDRGSTVTKVPFFADIPLIGWLFKSNAVREEKRELLIFVTPRIIKQDVI